MRLLEEFRVASSLNPRVESFHPRVVKPVLIADSSNRAVDVKGKRPKFSVPKKTKAAPGPGTPLVFKAKKKTVDGLQGNPHTLGKKPVKSLWEQLEDDEIDERDVDIYNLGRR